MTRQHLGQCCLSRTDISCNGDVHNMSKFAYPFDKQKNKHFTIVFLKTQIYDLFSTYSKIFSFSAQKNVSHTFLRFLSLPMQNPLEAVAFPSKSRRPHTAEAQRLHAAIFARKTLTHTYIHKLALISNPFYSNILSSMSKKKRIFAFSTNCFPSARRPLNDFFKQDGIAIPDHMVVKVFQYSQY